MSTPPTPTLLCHRCGTELMPGSGDFYEVRIEAVADPNPPTISHAELHRNAQEAQKIMRALIKKMEHLSERELMDQVYRRMTLHLCRPCYVLWIENPTDPPAKNG